ncbi:putative ABC transport system ATPase component [Klebsiella michiganensis]|uniref:Putative ABC transport system ATPase component n=1 Tax=Klebsiella michiganensis TaxID=1134687 RepID=A0A7H4N4Y7_9ENTR|nr:putative ABC transport system ATPase component [Klebsiella michiganensis]
MALVPGLSIAENIMLDRLASRGSPSAGGGCASWRARRWLSLTSASTYAAPSTAVRWRKNSKSCWPARCRITAGFLILDEPTAPLDQNESERLFAVVRRLQRQGIGIVFISHRIHELKAVCDTPDGAARRPAD